MNTLPRCARLVSLSFAVAVAVAALLTAIAGARIARAHTPRGRHRQ